MSRLYTEAELLKAVDYACGMQLAEDYKIADGMLYKDTLISKDDVLLYLDALAIKDIPIEEIEDYLKTK